MRPISGGDAGDVPGPRHEPAPEPPPGGATPSADPPPGGAVLRSLTTATVIFAVATAGAVALPGPVRVAATVYDLALFLGGSVLFLAAFLVAVGRSRREDMSLAGTFFLAGTAPAGVRRGFLVLLASQVVVALVAASVRPYTAVAFAVLAPMSAFGAMAWWGARHGRPAGSNAGTGPG